MFSGRELIFPVKAEIPVFLSVFAQRTEVRWHVKEQRFFEHQL